jgi:CRISPR-associated protein Cmr1
MDRKKLRGGSGLGVDATRRMPPSCPDIPKGSEPFPGKERWSLDIRLITPLFGGGPDAGKNDPVTLIRGTSIRGQLRFWWRATKGAAFTGVTELRRRENDIWGDTGRASLVAVHVKVTGFGVSAPCAEYRQGRRGWELAFAEHYPGYALFPFQGKSPDKLDALSPSSATNGCSFTVSLIYPSAVSDDVRAAVWAWVNFGGIGARTRRGCGSLYCAEISPPAAGNISRWYAERLAALGLSPLGAALPWPTLPATLLARTTETTPLKAWGEVNGLLSKFRQAVNFGRDSKEKGRPGRSRWPEADTIRVVTGKCSGGHEPRRHIPQGYPRAEFGLPIIFHFKDQREGDPEDVTLYPTTLKGSEVPPQRMASPLVLKALAVGNAAEPRAVPVILRLNVAPLAGVRVEGKQVRRGAGGDTAQIRGQALATYDNAPMKGLSQQGSALEAFLNYARSKGGYQ